MYYELEGSHKDNLGGVQFFGLENAGEIAEARIHIRSAFGITVQWLLNWPASI